MFDTLKLARHLEASGLAPAVAAGASEALADALIGSNFVTKDDLRNEISGVRAEITSVRGEITNVRHDMELLRRDLTIKVGGMMVIGVGILLAAIRYLPPHP